MVEDSRRSASPARARTTSFDASRGHDSTDKTACKAENVVDYAMNICQSVDRTARLDSVVKSGLFTVVKLDPGSEKNATKQLATLAALRLAFPFYTISLVENSITGASQLQLLFCSDEHAYTHAKDHFREYKAFRALRALSLLLAFSAVISFWCLLYVDAFISLQTHSIK